MISKLMVYVVIPRSSSVARRRHVSGVVMRGLLYAHSCSLVNLLIDTGSSNTWVGAQGLANPFVDSGTTQELGQLAVCFSSSLRDIKLLIDFPSSP